MNKSIANSKKENNEKTKRKAYLSLILFLLTVSLFITATFAWFTDSAFSKGNKVMAGNLFVDIVIHEDELIERYRDQWNTYHSTSGKEFDSFSMFLSARVEDGGLNKNYKYYTRNYEDGSLDTYYIITSEDEGLVNLYNVEPGQAWSLDITYANNGDLALKAAGALKLDIDENGKPKSYTGIETLYNQLNNNEYVYYNDYAVNADSKNGTDDTIDPELINKGLDKDGETKRSYSYTNDGFLGDSTTVQKEFKRRFLKLFKYQGSNVITTLEYMDLSPDEQLKYTRSNFEDIDEEIGGSYFIDDGGHLEDVLEVYLTKDREEINKGHESEAYFGSLVSFELLTTYGPNADPNFDYDLYTKEDTTKKLDALDENIPEEHYMILNESLSANLYNDYQNYLTFASGYCLPKDAIKGTGDIYPKDGVNVLAYDKDGNIINDDKYKGVSELGKTFITLYMPTDADSKYQNASISLQLGVTATQVEYEMDDTGFMIYDKFGDNNSNPSPLANMPIKGSEIILNDGNKYKVLSVNGSKAFVLGMNDINTSLSYWQTNQTTFFIDTGGNSVEGTKYEGSNLDEYLENTWYEDLKTSEPEMYAAIQPKVIAQNKYEYKDDCNNSYEYVAKTGEEFAYKFLWLHPEFFGYYNYLNKGKASSFTRHVFALDLKDIYDFYNDRSITSNDVVQLFFDSTKSQSNYIWLSCASSSQVSGPSDYDKLAWAIEGDSGQLSLRNVTLESIARPSFVIDLANEGIEYKVNPCIKYKDSYNDIRIVNFEVGDVVTLDSGLFGSFASPKGNIVMKEGDVIDLTSSKYTINANSGYISNGFSYDEDNKKFIAEYYESISKGDIIELSNNENYRILKLDGRTATLMSVNGVYLEDNYSPYKTSFLDKSGNKVDGIDYSKIFLGMYLNQTANTEYEFSGCYYSNLPNEIRSAIIDSEINQHIYDSSSNSSDFDTYDYKVSLNDGSAIYFKDYGQADSKKYHIYNIGVEDIFKYFEKNELTVDELSSFVFSKVWLSSASKYDDENIYCFTNYPSKPFIHLNASYAYAGDDNDPTLYTPNACPTFKIDLSGYNVTYIKKNVVSFNTFGICNAPGRQLLLNNQKIEEPILSTISGYSFDGWYKEPEFINKWDFDNDLVCQNTVLYGKFLPIIDGIYPKDALGVTYDLPNDISKVGCAWQTDNSQYVIGYNNQGNVSLVFQHNDKKVTINLSESLIKDGNNYKYINNDGVCFTFVMSGNTFTSIIVSGDTDGSGNNINGTYINTGSKKVVLWENTYISEEVSYGNTFCFNSKSATIECGDPIYKFDDYVWENIIKSEYIYLVFKSVNKDFNLYVTNSNWSTYYFSDEPYYYISIGNSAVKYNESDDTFTLKFRICDNYDFLSTIDSRCLLFTGAHFIPLQIYYNLDYS